MPIVELHVLQGYSSADKQRLGTALTDAVRSIVVAPPEAITVMIHEMPGDHYYLGGSQRRPGSSHPEPVDIVRNYLLAMEQRRLDDAKTFLAADFAMRFPGTDDMHTLEQLLDWAGPRYRFVQKTYDGFDAMQSSGDAMLVYCRGTLSGEWPNGHAFDGIRFIDRFEIVEGKIARQDVWNDLAEVKARA